MARLTLRKKVHRASPEKVFQHNRVPARIKRKEFSLVPRFEIRHGTKPKHPEKQETKRQEQVGQFFLLKSMPSALTKSLDIPTRPCTPEIPNQLDIVAGEPLSRRLAHCDLNERQFLLLKSTTSALTKSLDIPTRPCTPEIPYQWRIVAGEPLSRRLAHQDLSELL
ncbi:hypothetical protein GYMLUDRAFT_244176 [Collybiopsis luxurians FD-317 M1]|uniref:Uncharacterized protein n=1 Tax=Collybiopsis luxurians FD-317 M1 TaxID=944289 RepID=A0A0D0CP45_9AGAR|nr:hypothetical protein GYMLUDRAFT_244176 [Collybiopsis luxurians FD-317 M1]